MYGLGETDGKIVDAFLGSALLVTLSVSVTTPPVNEEIEYSVTVTNIGQNVLADITLFETLSISDELKESRNQAGTSKLEPDVEYIFQRVYTPEDSGSLNINATVMGVGPAANPVSDTSDITIEVQPVVS